MEKQQLVRMDNPAPIAMEQRHDDNPSTLIALAIEKGLDLKDLVLMRKEWRAEKAKEAFDAAMAAFQAECPVIYKTKGVPTKSGDIAYKYCPFEEVIAQVKPLLLKHGFSFQLGTDVESKDGWVIATCKVTHSGGHSEQSEAKFPLGAGTQIMSTTQVYAAALSFASRRVFMNSFGVIAASEDMDGRLEQAKRRVEGPSKIATIKSLKNELWELLKPVRGTAPNTEVATRWLRNTGILQPDEKLEGLSAERLSEVIDQATAQLQKEA